MLKDDGFSSSDWLSIPGLGSSVTWCNSPDSVVVWLGTEADFLVSAEAGKDHWRDWLTVEVESLVGNDWVGNDADLLTKADWSLGFTLDWKKVND